MKVVITVEVPDGASVSVGDQVAAPAPAKPAKVVTKSAPTAAPAVAPVATAPAAAAPAQPQPQAPTFPPITKVNDAVSALAALQPDGRDLAIAILKKHGASKTPQLKPESYQAVIDEAEEATDRINAAAAQVANSGSLV